MNPSLMHDSWSYFFNRMIKCLLHARYWVKWVLVLQLITHMVSLSLWSLSLMGTKTPVNNINKTKTV